MEKNKRKYVGPEIVEINIDSEISLQLESSPAVGPDESALNSYEAQNQSDPFRNTMV